MGKKTLNQSKISLYDYYILNWKWCLLTLLFIIEIIIFTWHNSMVNDSFLEYLNERVNFDGNVFLYIFIGNTHSALSLLLMGLIPFGIGSLFCAFGALENIVLSVKYLLTYVSTRELILSTIAHGVLEATAFYLSFVSSILLSKAITSSILCRIIGKKKGLCLLEESRMIFESICYLLLPLLLIAAVFEVTVSWWIIVFYR